MGESYELRKDYPNAEAEFRLALERCPDPYLPGLHYSLGNAYWMEAKWDQAIEQFKQELAISPDNYLVTWKIGDCYVYQRDYAQALPYLQKALKQKPGFHQAERDMGKLYIQIGKPEEALVYLQKAAKADPEEASLHYLMAQAYRKMGKQDELKTELELFQKYRKQETDRAARHPGADALGGIDTSKERPAEEESLDDLK